MSKLRLSFIIVSAFLFINYYANPPDGYTGAPLNNEYSCTICHQTGTNSPFGHSDIIGFPSKIVPGKEYKLRVNIQSNDPRAKYSNFQLMIVDKDSSVGTFTKPIDYVKFSKYKNREYAECRPAVKIKNNALAFEFSWKAPDSDDNKLISLYFTTIFANGDASFAGDRIIESKRFGILGNSLDVSIDELQNNLCPNDSSAYVKLDVAGGQEPYSFLWSTGDTTQEIYSLKTGEYYVTVTDKNGLEGVGYAKISEPGKMKLTIVEKIDITDNNKGSVKIEIEGGSGNYSYKWYKDGAVFSNEKNISNLDASCYRLIVEDSCHSTIDSTICIDDLSATIEANKLEEITISPNPAKDYILINVPNDDYNSIKIVSFEGKITPVNIFDKNKINVSDLTTGLYYLILNFKNKRVVKKFIVIR